MSKNSTRSIKYITWLWGKLRFRNRSTRGGEDIVSVYRIRDMIEESSDMSRVDQEYIQQMSTTNEAMLELFQELTEMAQDQGKQITKFISPIEELTKLLA